MSFSRVGACCILAAISYLQAAEVWTKDLEAGGRQAVQEGKNLILVFTGSDWSSPCQSLRQKVLEAPEFSAFAQKFILVSVDMHKNPKMTAEELARLGALQSQHAVAIFPSLLLIDARSGEEYGRVAGYDNASASAYVARLSSFENSPEARLKRRNEARARQAEMKEASVNQGLIDKAVAARDYPAAAAVIDRIFKGLKGPDKAKGTLQKAILSYRIDRTQTERTWNLLRLALFEAEDDKETERSILEIANRIAPAKKLEKLQPASNKSKEKRAEADGAAVKSAPKLPQSASGRTEKE